MHKETNNTTDFVFGETEDLFNGFTPLIEGLQPETTKSPKAPAEQEQEEEVEEVEETVSEDDDLPEEVLNKLNNQNQDNESEEDQEEQSEEYEYSYKEIAGHLADIGLLDELEDDVEDTPEALELAVRKTVENSISAYKESIPDVGKQFLDYLEKGGDPYKFLETVNTNIDYKTLDLDDEDNQKLVLREYFKTQDWTQEEIDDAIADYEEGLILKKRAEKAVKDLEKIHSRRIQELQAEQEQIIAERVKQHEEYINTIKNTIHSSNQIAGLQITDAEKAQFEKYLLETDKDGLTRYAREIQENPIQTQIELAYLKFKKFDFSKVAKEIRTKETRNFKRKIVETDKTVGSSINRNVSKNDGGLAAFRNLGL